MLKAILLFIKAHAIATAVTTTVVVGTAVAAPIAVSNYNLDKKVRENLSLLAPSNIVESSNKNEETNNNKETDDNEMSENNQEQNETNTAVNTDEPLTFRIEEVVVEQEMNMTGEGEQVVIGTGKERRIVPSYDKDYSKWTKAEKEAYQKAIEDLAKMAQEEYEKSLKSESEKMLDAMERVNKTMASFSKEYMFFLDSSESWKYNSYAKLYINYNDLYDSYNVTLIGEGLQGISVADFRNIVYPKLLEKIKKHYQQIGEGDSYTAKEKQEQIDQLNELYHLSD